MPLFDLFIQFRFRYLKNLGNSIIDFFSQIKGLFRTFGIIDVVDILFVAIDVAEMKKTIDATCKACAEMSDAKIGALIVFENDTLLGDIIASGTIVDGTPSKELIGNIFYPKSPLHDGAMVIRGSSIYAAGCILPLTKNNDLSSQLGTRHRAALGLSEQSDAIVFVVSEERGEISCAVNGTLRRDISTGDMRDILTQQYIPDNISSDDKIISKLKRRFK